MRHHRHVDCSVDGCGGNSHYTAWGKRGYCAKHYAQWRRTGGTETFKAPNGAGCVFGGYKLIYVDGRQMPEHRHVMEQHLGRPLLPFPHEVVHHINGDKLDNRVENLEVITQAVHAAEHHTAPVFRSDSHRECTKCHAIKPLSDFSRQNWRNDWRSDCKKCQVEYNRQREAARRTTA